MTATNRDEFSSKLVEPERRKETGAAKILRPFRHPVAASATTLPLSRAFGSFPGHQAGECERASAESESGNSTLTPFSLAPKSRLYGTAAELRPSISLLVLLISTAILFSEGRAGMHGAETASDK